MFTETKLQVSIAKTEGERAYALGLFIEAIAAFKEAKRVIEERSQLIPMFMRIFGDVFGEVCN